MSAPPLDLSDSSELRSAVQSEGVTPTSTLTWPGAALWMLMLGTAGCDVSELPLFQCAGGSSSPTDGEVC